MSKQKPRITEKEKRDIQGMTKREEEQYWLRKEREELKGGISSSYEGYVLEYPQTGHSTANPSIWMGEDEDANGCLSNGRKALENIYDNEKQ